MWEVINRLRILYWELLIKPNWMRDAHMYFHQWACQHTPDVVQYDNIAPERDERKEVFDQHHTIFFLLARSVDVRKEQRDVMATDERHDASIIKAIHSRLLLLAICCFIWGFALVDHFIRYSNFVLLWRMLACSIDSFPDFINLQFRKEVNGIIKWWAVSCGTSMLMVEVPIHGDMNITTTIQGPPKVLTTEACRALLH